MAAHATPTPRHDFNRATTCDWKHCGRVNRGSEYEHERLPCSSSVCDRSVHAKCLADLVITLQVPSGFNKAVCSQSCYDGISDATRSGLHGVTTTWYNDNPARGVCSMNVLLEWLERGDNYKRYTSSEGKREVAQEACNLLRMRGVEVTRTPLEVVKQISRLEREFQAANEWLAEPSQREALDVSMEAVRILCPLFDRLKPFMQRTAALKEPHSKRKRTAALEEPPPKRKRTTNQPRFKDTTRVGTAPAPHPRAQETPYTRAEARIEAAFARATTFHQEAYLLRLKTTSMALHERIQLRKEGVSQAEIDLLIPPHRSE